jgi:pimeloyl-ACP methyl ester carboxylesterase
LERASVNDITLEYEVCGNGEPVAFIHGALVADTFWPLLADDGLAARFRMIAYHRRGYAGSSHPAGPISVSTQAADCYALLRHLGFGRAHIVGHSYGGAVALQLALDSPEIVHSLALLEPALMLGESAEAYRASLVAGVQRYQAEGPAAIIDEFFQARWPGYRVRLERVLPGAFEQAVADAATSFEGELPGLLEWRFGEDQAQRITQPTLLVLGGGSQTLSPRFSEVHGLLLEWLPHAEGIVLPGLTHFLQVEDSRAMAEALDDFYRRVPLSS